MKERILIVDDEKKMVRLIRTCLQQEGYLTDEAYDGASALEIFAALRPDLVVLDVMMPRLDGFEFCRRARESTATPIIILSARSEETDKLVGLELGADDYVTKPFSLLELVARIRALLRRRGIVALDGGGIISEGPLRIDSDRRTVVLDGADLPLTATEFCLLKFLASNPASVFNRRELMEAAQGDFFNAYERTVDAHVGNIRKKAGDLAPGWSFIDTVHGVGYRFNVKKTP